MLCTKARYLELAHESLPLNLIFFIYFEVRIKGDFLNDKDSGLVSQSCTVHFGSEFVLGKYSVVKKISICNMKRHFRKGHKYSNLYYVQN